MSTRNSTVLSLLFATTAVAQAIQEPRYPQGIYVKLTADHASMINTFVANPAIAGLTVSLNWADLNLNPPTSAELPAPLDCKNLPTYTPGDTYNWTIPDAAFCAAASANPPRTIRLNTDAGYNSPQWVLDQINANTCGGNFVFLAQPYYATEADAPYQPPYPNPGCHLAYFENNEGTATKVDPTTGDTEYNWSPLPLPWDATYKTAWRTFQTAMAARYGQNPLLVSVTVAGPTADSTEILYNHLYSAWATILQNQFPSSYWNSDQAIIDEWQNAIDMFGEVYSDLTLNVHICCDDHSGLPDLSASFTPPPGATAFCGPSPTMGCTAEFAIISYFTQSGVGGRNAKALENDGQQAYPEVILGTTAIKTVTSTTEFSTRILGGAEFSGPLNFPTLGGEQTVCPDTIPATFSTPCSPQQAFYNTIADFFDGTVASPLVPRFYDSATIAAFPTLAGFTKFGFTPINYLQIYAFDILSPPGATITTGTGFNPTYTGQDLLNLAAFCLQLTAERPLPVNQ